MNSGSQSVLSKSTRLMEPLNWRRWPETYKNSGLNILRCIARRPGMDEEFRHRLEQLENSIALLERNQDLLAGGQRARRAREEESVSPAPRTNSSLSALPVPPPADVDLRAISAAPAQPDGFP